jgi:FAD/FMN-containing dehydrogenase/Fe-S oxidoreductase
MPSIDPTLEHRLRSAIRGDVLCDNFSRGRYATDASIYQMFPLGVVVPSCTEDVLATLEIAREAGLPVLPRGGGTSQVGQTVNEALVIDVSKHLNRLVEFDAEAGTAVVEPGMVLDQLNAQLAAHGLWYPVDVSTSSRATLGGMAANNSCGSRSIRYRTMRDNVQAIDAILADGTRAHFGPLETSRDVPAGLADFLTGLGAQEADEIRLRFPDLMRRVGGYNIDALLPDGERNLAHLLVGSEGTLAYSERLHLRLSPLLRNRALGICHFPTFYAAMEAPQHIVGLGPTAVELVDRTMIDLARDIAIFQPVVQQMVRGEPGALLLVEFAEPDQAENLRRLADLNTLMGDLGYAWDAPANARGGVIEAVDPAQQKAIWEVRKQGLNIMMSMKSDGKPVSFVEDCAVRLEDLAEYTRRLTEIFHKHGTDGTWYAHASVGTLHVRPVLNLKLDGDVRAMRAIAEEAFEMVREYRGSHSGEHGDGIARSEFHRDMFGERMVRNFEAVKDRFDPAGLLNPGKIVRAPKLDDRELFRYPPGYHVPELETALDWSGWTGAGGGFQGAVEMCNNNGACRKLGDGAMCPSYRVTRNERDLVRGRANTLRLALSGQLGPHALTSDQMHETLQLCVSCKACRRECPTGVDMARMKIEVLAARAKRHGIGLHERLIAWLPRYAPWLSRLPWLGNARDRVPGLAALGERLANFSARRSLPRWRRDRFRDDEPKRRDGQPVVLLADTFNRHFEPENLRATVAVLEAAGYRVIVAAGTDSGRPLCCGRTFLAAGLVDEARAEAQRLLDAVSPWLEAGVPVIGLEPSCLLTLRDEFPAMLPGEATATLARSSFLLEEFLAREADEGRLELPLKPLQRKVWLHGHCHQKAFNVMSSVDTVLGMIPGLEVETIASSCCGMAGNFGYHRDTYEVSVAMGELSLLPAVRAADPNDLIVADGASCRHQVGDGTGRAPLHVAQVLQMALEE